MPLLVVRQNCGRMEFDCAQLCRCYALKLWATRVFDHRSQFGKKGVSLRTGSMVGDPLITHLPLAVLALVDKPPNSLHHAPPARVQYSSTGRVGKLKYRRSTIARRPPRVVVRPPLCQVFSSSTVAGFRIAALNRCQEAPLGSAHQPAARRSLFQDG